MEELPLFLRYLYLPLVERLHMFSFQKKSDTVQQVEAVKFIIYSSPPLSSYLLYRYTENPGGGGGVPIASMNGHPEGGEYIY